MKKIKIHYIATSHQGATKKLNVDVLFADDIARNILKKQEESIFVKKSSGGGSFFQWLNLLAMLQGYSRAKFESAEEVK